MRIAAGQIRKVPADGLEDQTCGLTGSVTALEHRKLI
jgi:hypothetical protein